MKAITVLQQEVSKVVRSDRYLDRILDEVQSILGESIARGREASPFPETDGKYLLSARGLPYAQMLERSGFAEKVKGCSSAPWTITEQGEALYRQRELGEDTKATALKRQVRKATNVQEVIARVTSELQGTILYNRIEDSSPLSGRYRVEPLGLERLLASLGLATKQRGCFILTRRAERLYRDLEREGHYQLRD